MEHEMLIVFEDIDGGDEAAGGEALGEAHLGGVIPRELLEDGVETVLQDGDIVEGGTERNKSSQSGHGEVSSQVRFLWRGFVTLHLLREMILAPKRIHVKKKI
jgi:hypothetical protein